MAAPTQQYMTIFGGANETTYTTPLINIGDNITISGTASNNGNFTVVDVIDSGAETITDAGNDVYYLLKGRALISEVDSDLAAVTVRVHRGIGDKLLAIGNADNLSIDVWSFNSSTADSIGDAPALAENNGWTQDAINPTNSGTNASYIYHFADECLRVCNTNESNSSMIKWYGYIQRSQFNKNTSLKFSGWEEHPNLLKSPANVSGISIGFLNGAGSGNEHDGTNQGNNYYKNNRGVAYLVKGAQNDGTVVSIALDGAIAQNHATILFDFDDTETDNKGNDQFNAGDVVTINKALGTSADEFLFCTKPSIGDSAVTFKRNYGTHGITSYADNVVNILKRGKAFNVGITEDSSLEGLWPSSSWELHQTFIYDGSQESLPVQMGDGAASIAKGVYPSSGVTVGNFALTVSTFWDVAYSGRISGGRVYIREANSSDPLTLLLDVDIEKGARTSMLDDYTPFGFDAGDGHYVISLKSISQNIDTYTSLNGFSPEEDFIDIGNQGDIYKSSVISGRRTFIANVKHKNKSFESIKYGDRIMYSELNKFDTFLSSNFIDVSKGDYGEYVALESYADRLLAYKHNLLHIINISNPNPSSWYLESTQKYSGVSYPFAVTKTEYGIAWINEFGCFFYDGEKVVNLIEGKIPVTNKTQYLNNTNWSEFINGDLNLKDAIIGYDALSNLLIIGRSPNDGTTASNKGFTYCFNTGGWTYNTNLFEDSETYTNFAIDWNNNLIRGRQLDADSVTFEKYLPVMKSQASQELVTKDIDFGQPGVLKKIYKVIVTHRANTDVSNAVSYQKDGRVDTYATFSSTTLPTNGIHWKTTVFNADTVIKCNSIAFKIGFGTGTFEVNDITVEYRVLKGVTS